MAVTGAATMFCFKLKLYNVLSNVTYSPSHRQADTPVINIQSTLRTAPDLLKNVSLQCYLVSTVIRIQSLRSQVRVHIHTHVLHNTETLVGQKKFKKFETAVNTVCQGNPSACHFGNSCRRFGSPGLGFRVDDREIAVRLSVAKGPDGVLWPSSLICNGYRGTYVFSRRQNGRRVKVYVHPALRLYVSPNLL